MFIVLEGIDGAGKGRQREELVRRCTDRRVAVSSVGFPDHDGFLYRELIHPALHDEKTVSKEGMFLTFALDQLLWQDRIRPCVGSSSRHFIADGYFTTNIVYQCIVHGNFTIDEALRFASTFHIAIPDVTIFLDVDPEVAMARKRSEDGHREGLDLYERSDMMQKAIRAGFLSLVRGRIFGEWSVVNGMGSIEQTTANVLHVLNERRFRLV